MGVAWVRVLKGYIKIKTNEKNKKKRPKLFGPLKFNAKVLPPSAPSGSPHKFGTPEEPQLLLPKPSTHSSQ